MSAPKAPVEVALEEWKLLDGVIARLEDVEYKIRSWLFPLLTALAVAPVYSVDVDVPEWFFLAVSLILVAAFMAIELIHRLPKRQAINRARDVEEFLRGKKAVYDGPKMTISLTTSRRPVVWSESWRMIKHGPYIPLVALVLLVHAVYIIAL